MVHLLGLDTHVPGSVSSLDSPAVFLTLYLGLIRLGTWWSLTTKGKISRGVLVSVKGEGGLGEEKMAQPRMGQDLFMSA